MEHIHLIGIGGAGLSAIARILVEKGCQVSGSDKLASPMSSNLEKMGVRITIGHAPENVAGADLIVRSSAVQDNNVEVIAARKLNIPVLKRADFLRDFLKPYHVIAVGGTHGKTTTTAMLAWILHVMELDPSYIIGGVSIDLMGNAHAGTSRYFVIEADEYDRMFLGLQPSQIIITNIQHDHPDCFPTMADYLSAFVEFCQQLHSNGQLTVCQDDLYTRELITLLRGEKNVSTYGYDDLSNYQIKHVDQNISGGYRFDMIIKGNLPRQQTVLKVNLNIPGRHNISNAAAALAVIDQLGLPLKQAVMALNHFSGSGRRFEILGVVNKVVIISDYAHHPTQVETTLQAARDAYPSSRVWAVWQPHTYSRTNLLLNEFSQAFTSAHKVIVTDIYAAREPDQPFPYADFLVRMKHPDAHHYSDMEIITNILVDQLQPDDVLIILSAGDADQIGRDVLDALKKNNSKGAK